MTRLRSRLLILVLVTWTLATTPSPAAPALGDKPPRFEYAELQFRQTAAAGRIVIGGAGVAQPVAPAAAQPTVRWTTGDDEVIVKTWEELAEKLKAPSPKKEGATVTQQKLRVLNKLGADGWEMVEHTGTDGTTGLATWTFKRRVP
jgi:hypothetical protein